jgi:hypothetical protein
MNEKETQEQRDDRVHGILTKFDLVFNYLGLGMELAGLVYPIQQIANKSFGLEDALIGLGCFVFGKKFNSFLTRQGSDYNRNLYHYVEYDTRRQKVRQEYESFGELKEINYVIVKDFGLPRVFWNRFKQYFK